MIKVIIISGKSGHGKDKSAHFMKEILEQHKKKVLIIHYADVLKYFLTQYYNYDGDKTKPENRTLLQHVGTDLMRTKYENYWVSIVIGFLSALEDYSDFDVALVPDARFENEVNLPIQFLKDVTTLRINRKDINGEDWINPLLTNSQLVHASEISLDKYVFDYTIINDGDINLLKDNCELFLKDAKFI